MFEMMNAVCLRIELISFVNKSGEKSRNFASINYWVISLLPFEQLQRILKQGPLIS